MLLLSRTLIRRWRKCSRVGRLLRAHWQQRIARLLACRLSQEHWQDRHHPCLWMRLQHAPIQDPHRRKPEAKYLLEVEQLARDVSGCCHNRDILHDARKSKRYCTCMFDGGRDADVQDRGYTSVEEDKWP